MPDVMSEKSWIQDCNLHTLNDFELWTLSGYLQQAASIMFLEAQNLQDFDTLKELQELSNDIHDLRSVKGFLEASNA